MWLIAVVMYRFRLMVALQALLLCPGSVASDDIDVCNTTTSQNVSICDETPWSCKNKCGRLQALPCSCDGRCIIYRTCCEDFNQQCPSLRKESLEKWSDILPVNLTCSGYPGQTFISGCSDISVEDEISQKCHSDEWNSFEEFVPVTDLESGNHFRNIYCHRCNVVNGTAVRWSGTFSLRRDQIAKARTKEGLFQSMRDLSIIFWKAPFDESTTRLCVRQEENTCSVKSNCQPTEIREKCEAFWSFVLGGPRSKVFPNKYCLMCAGAEMQCTVPKMKSLDKPSGIKYPGVLEYNVSKGIWKITMTKKIFPFEEIHCSQNGKIQFSCLEVQCARQYPLLNGTCSHGFFYFVIIIKFKVIAIDRTPKMIENTIKGVIRLIVDKTVSILKRNPFNMTNLHVTDRSAELNDWDVVMQIRTLLGISMFQRDLHNAGTITGRVNGSLIASIAQLFKRASGNASICFEVYSIIPSLLEYCAMRHVLQFPIGNGFEMTSSGEFLLIPAIILVYLSV